MYWHTSSRLRGPLSRDRAWWKTPPSRADAVLRLRVAPEVEIRTDLVARVRREIAEGRYDTPEKWDAALDRLMVRLERP